MRHSFLFSKHFLIISFVCVSVYSGYSQKKSEIAAPMAPQLPVIPEKTYKVTDFGAKPNDGIDDTQAIQTAISTASVNGGGRVVFPDGIYDISVLNEATRAAGNEILTLQSKVALEAENSRKATIRLADNQPQYGAIFRSARTGADDVRIKGLVIDANATNNQLKSYDDFKFIHEGKILRWLPKTAVASRNGKRIHIVDVHFTNSLDINTINIGAPSGATGDQLERVSDVTIEKCLFDNIGWQEFDYDHSTIYTQANRFVITDCTFKSRNGAGTLSARCAIETHGSDQVVKNNEIIGFTIGINVTGTQVLSHRQLIENNKFVDVARGVYMWASGYKRHDEWTNLPMLSDVVIRDNVITLAPDAWLASAVPSRRHIKGIGTNPYNKGTSIANLLIEGNSITTSGYENAVKSYRLSTFESAIGLHTIPMKNVYIINNDIGRHLGPSIGGDSAIDGLVVESNKLAEPEIATLSANKERAAILLTGEMKNSVISKNTITVGKSNNLKYGILAKGNHKIEENTIHPSTTPLQP